MTHHLAPIGLFDSGIGGLTVMKEFIHKLPQEKILYFGDTARVPYGNKSGDTILRYAIENTIFLLQKRIKLLVIPCNTATAYALEKLRHLFNIPIIGVIEPGARAAVAATKNQRIAILGTKGTIQSGVYQAAIQQFLPTASLFPMPCPLFVPLVEEGWIDHAITRSVIKEYLAPLMNLNVDTILLGCTHYPLLKELIQEVVGNQITLVDSALATAEEAKKLLKEKCLLSPMLQGEHEYFVSDDPKKFKESAEQLFGFLVETVNHSTYQTN